MDCINGCTVISNLVTSLVPYISHEKKKKKEHEKKFHNLKARKGLTKNLDVVLLPVDYDSGRA